MTKSNLGKERVNFYLQFQEGGFHHHREDIAAHREGMTNFTRQAGSWPISILALTGNRGRSEEPMTSHSWPPVTHFLQ